MTRVALSARALCNSEDVERLVPGFQFDEPTEDAITDLINQESELAHERAGREFQPISNGPSQRLFDVGDREQASRIVRIGDAAAVTAVAIQALDGTILETVAAGSYVPLPRVRQPWQPIRELWFPASGVAAPASALTTGRVIAVTATWGFPAVPDMLRGAIAKLVLVRYAAQPASFGTSLDDALADLNLGALFAQASETIELFADPQIA
jgi:hypothetical protein